MTLAEPGYPYTFDPEACTTCNGHCCNGESGNIWVNRSEITTISEFLKMEPRTFMDTYLRKISYRYSIVELKSNDNYACVFYDVIKRGCTIYDVRPGQCRTFPFWPYFRENPGEIFKECPGVSPKNNEAP
jgi:Fe-S-cluster containining protein